MKKLLLCVLTAVILAVMGFFLLNTKSQPKPKVKDIPLTTITPPTIVRVTLGKTGFTPVSITIRRGEYVMWINQSGEKASVNSDPYPKNNLYKFLNLGEFPNGFSVQTVFQNKGKYGYHNQLNPAQKGTVTVE